MVKKIIFSCIFVCLLIAIPLALLGYKQVDLGSSFLAFLRSTNNELNDFKIAIPEIPNIDKINTESANGNDILSVLINLANGLISFVNIIILLINVLAMALNVVISLIQFLVLLLKNLIFFKDTIAANNPLPVV